MSNPEPRGKDPLRLATELPPAFEISDASSQGVTTDAFCLWGCRTVKPSHGGLKRASYGQIAKTLNVVLKAAVYYCGLPDKHSAARLRPWLHPAIDNPMTKYLRGKFRKDSPVGVGSIAQVDKRGYQVLLDLAGRDIEKDFGGALTPIQWEDIVWLTINGKMI